MGRGSLQGRWVETGEPISVRFDGETIVSIEAVIDDGRALPWIAPGLVDLQVNGFAGIDLNSEDASPDRVAALTRALLRVGVTSYLPTIVTATPEEIEARLAADGGGQHIDLQRRAAPAHREIG